MKNGSLRKTILSGMFWKISERFLAQGISFIISIVLARLLMPEEYGKISIVLVFISIADVFISSGFSSALIQKKDADDVDFSTIFYCSFITSVLLYVCIFFCAPLIADFYHEMDLVMLLRIYALILPVGVYGTIQHAYISRHMQFKKFFFSTLFGTLISGMVGIFLAYNGFGVWSLVVQSFTNTIVDTLALMITVSWHPQRIFSFKSAKKLMSYGSKLLLADLSGTFFGQLRSLVIGHAYTSADLAFYNRGQHIPTLITGNIGQSIVAVLFPAISNESDNVQRVKQLTRKALKYMVFVMFPALFGIAAIASPLVSVLLTDKWMESVPYLQLLSIGAAIGLLSTVSLQTIKSIGKGDVVLKLELWKKPVFVFLLLVGVKKGVLAIAITMVIYELYGTIINMWQMKKYINYAMIEQIKDIFPALILSGVMGLIVNNFFEMNNVYFTLIVKIMFGFIIYILGAQLLHINEFGRLKETLLNIFRKRSGNE